MRWQALLARAIARLNLDRTRVAASSDGIVTSLDLQAGAHVSAGHPVLALVDRNSFYADGYFEETKLPGISLGDPVSVSPMGARQELSGHLDSFAQGIADRDRDTAGNLLPDVNPTFHWVRLVSGQTVTVEVHHRQDRRVALR